MRTYSLSLAFTILAIPVFVLSQSLSELDAQRVRLPNGWSLTPVGKSLPLGDLPLNLALSPDGKYLAVTNNGQSVQSIQLIDVEKQVVADSREVRVSWYGLVWAGDSRSFYASGGNGNYIMFFQVKDGKLVQGDSIRLGDPWPEKISVAGIALDEGRNLLYAVTKENNSLYVVDLAGKKGLHRFPLGGEGFTCLLLFGEKITPNQHALAREFVLLDNFYVDGEVSADGHNWSTGAYATDYLEKNWPTNYSGRGGTYDAEGTREIANNKNGFIWDLCKKYGVSYRTYGEFADDYTPNIPVLEDHFCPYYTSWDESVMDTTRFRQWRQDFDSLLAIDQVPQLNTLRFINDHTEGLRLGRPTPFAHVADNDHTMYSTSGMLRTIELILGLPPMSQYDAAAEPMWRCFSEIPDETPSQAIPAQVDLHEVNTAMNEWQRKSEEFDFSKEDSAPDDEFSRVIWYAVKGEGTPYPGPVRAAFLAEEEE